MRHALIVLALLLIAVPAQAERACWVDASGVPGYCGRAGDSQARKLEAAGYTAVIATRPTRDHVWNGSAWTLDQARKDARDLDDRVAAIRVLKIVIKKLRDKGVLSASDFTGDEKEAIRRLLQ